MKLIKLGLISIATLFVLTTLIGALLPSTVLVSRAVNINGPKDSIMLYINDIQQWKRWIEGMDKPEVVIHSPVNAELGRTTVNITTVSDSNVVSSWTGMSGNKQMSTIRLISEPEQKLTVVQWQFVQQLKWYPWEKLGSMMNDKILGTMMEKNLNTLKSVIEKNKPS